MSGEDRAEWLTVAGDAIHNVPAGLFWEACRHAQTICDHPAKIVPAIMAYAASEREDWERRNRPVVMGAPRLAVVRHPSPPRPKPMTQAEVDATPAHMINMGLKLGAIVRDADGNLRPAPVEG